MFRPVSSPKTTAAARQLVPGAADLKYQAESGREREVPARGTPECARDAPPLDARAAIFSVCAAQKVLDSLPNQSAK
jgi:hypothetical protein